jgi:hypothetical protein
VSFIRSPCYALAEFNHKILRPLAGKSESFVNNSGHFVQLLKPVDLRSSDTHVSFEVVSLVSNVPVDKALEVIIDKLNNDDTLAERSALQVEAIMELLEVCLRTTYFQVDDKFLQQKDAWLWVALYHPSLATSSCSILRNWLLTRHNINHCCGSGTLMTRLWSGPTVHRSYRRSSVTSII